MWTLLILIIGAAVGFYVGNLDIEDAVGAAERRAEIAEAKLKARPTVARYLPCSRRHFDLIAHQWRS